MQGSIAGDLIGAAYFFYFQLAGCLLALVLFQKENLWVRLLLGSVAGSVLLQWLPIPFSFLFGFSRTSHLLAMLPAVPVFYLFFLRRRALAGPLHGASGVLRRHKHFFVLLAVFMVLWLYLLYTHILLRAEDGSLYTGQCTYGDMNMHLGFITSIAQQSAFPADYSIFPGVKLSYPFLSDSISSSIYLFGASLRFAYILPMIFAMAQIFCAVYLLAYTVLGTRGKACAVFLLYFLNGGLGFCYFLDWASEREFSFADIFTGFYTTPTNLVEHNIRWVNVLADMFLPQRATLFGYAVLFPCLWLLYRACFCGERSYFIAAALYGGALPMIHTHSFLALGLISASWLLAYLYENTRPARERYAWGKWLLTGFAAGMCLIQYLNQSSILGSTGLMAIGILGIAVLFACGVWLLCRHYKAAGWKQFFNTWGVFLVIVLGLALPQLFYWTFGQVQSGGFVRGHFNWGNQGEFYPYFYLKNIGLPLLLIAGAVWRCRKKDLPLITAGAVIWFLAELIVFTPNTYDNNKLLYVAYLLLLLPAVDYGAEFYASVRSVSGARLFAGVFLFFCVFSGVLTLGREAVSEYQVYNATQVAVASFAEENTPTSAIFLTGTRHNNEVAALSGRSIVCGSSSYLYFHGIDTSDREADIRLMYEAPLENAELFAKYNVSYILVSDYERASYQVDTDSLAQQYELVFESGSAQIYAVK